MKDSKMILKKSAAKEYKRFLIINPFGIGDVLHTTPIIRALKVTYPDSFIAFWCNQRCAELLKNNPAINKIFPLSRGDLKKIYHQSKWAGIQNSLKLFLGLGKEKFDIALDFSLDHRYGLVTLLAGIKRRIGFDYKKRGKFLTDKITLKGYTDKHVVDYYWELLKPLDIKSKIYNLEFPATEVNIQKTKRLLSFRGGNRERFISRYFSRRRSKLGAGCGLQALVGFKVCPTCGFVNSRVSGENCYFRG